MSETLGNLQEMQLAAAYRRMRNSLKYTAPVTLVLGLVCVGISVDRQSGPSGQDIWATLLLTAAAFLALESIWVWLKTPPAALIINGTLMSVVGLGGFCTFLYGCVRGWQGSGRGMGYLLAVGVWGLINLSRYNKFKLAQAALSPLAMSRLNDVYAAVKHKKPADDPEMIEFQTESQIWKGQLMSDAIVLVRQLSSVIAIYGKDEFALESVGPPAASPPAVGTAEPGKKIKIQVKADGWVEKATMKQMYVPRYETWKSGAMAPASS